MKSIKIVVLLLCVIIGLTSCNNEEDVAKLSVHTDSTVAKTTFTGIYISYGPNVIHFRVTNDNFGNAIQEWISKNPDRIITSIGVNTSPSGHNDPIIGYFITHYPDSTFNPFRFK